MRMMLTVKMPHEPFNTLVREGTIGQKMQAIMQELKPEATYFSEYDGTRGCTMILNLDDASQVPAMAEPFFLTFNADCNFRICMTPEDLGKAGLDALGKKWG